VARVVEEDEWRDDVGDLAAQVEHGRTPPPVIVTYGDDELIVEDGNHTIEDIRRAGLGEAWVVIRMLPSHTGARTQDDRPLVGAGRARQTDEMVGLVVRPQAPSA
jgi:hypothetical protein